LDYLTATDDPGTTLEKLEVVVKATEIEFQIPDHEQTNDEEKHYLNLQASETPVECVFALLRTYPIQFF
jgi:hypothetical protein